MAAAGQAFGLEPVCDRYNDTKIGRACAPTEAPAHLYVASNELRSPGVRPEFRFSNGLFIYGALWALGLASIDVIHDVNVTSGLRRCKIL